MGEVINVSELHQEFVETFFRFHKLRLPKLFPDISHTEGILLEKIGSETEKGIRVSELARQIHVSTPSMSRTLRQLEEKGLVERSSASEDRRVTYVRLTDKGKKSRMHTMEIIKEYHASVLNRMDQKKLKQLILYLNELCDIAEDEINKRIK